MKKTSGTRPARPVQTERSKGRRQARPVDEGAPAYYTGDKKPSVPKPGPASVPPAED